MRALATGGADQTLTLQNGATPLMIAAGIVFSIHDKFNGANQNVAFSMDNRVAGVETAGRTVARYSLALSTRNGQTARWAAFAEAR